MKRLTWTQRAVWLALLLALAGSLRHVAWSFASIERGSLVPGYIQAAGVDLGLLALALGIQERRKMRRSTKALWVGVALFSAISIYANFLFGYVHADAVDAPLATWRPVALAAVLPVLVLFLSEIAGSDAQEAIAQAERDARKAEREALKAEQGSTLRSISAPDAPALPAPATYTCPRCGAIANRHGEPFRNGQQVAAHIRWEHALEAQVEEVNRE